MSDYRTETVTRPDHCQSCGATLKDVPFDGDNCPHCGHDVVNDPAHFGSDQWHKLPRAHRDTGA